MDTFCVQLGSLLDTGDVTLDFPDRHSFHCLIDEDVCRLSGYEMLQLSTGPDPEFTYESVARFDRVGNNMLVQFARQVRSCGRDCNGGNSRGLQATVTGTLEEDSSADRLLTVLTIQEGSVPCEQALEAVASMDPSAVLPEGTLFLSREDGGSNAPFSSMINGFLLCLILSLVLVCL